MIDSCYRWYAWRNNFNNANKCVSFRACFAPPQAGRLSKIGQYVQLSHCNKVPSSCHWVIFGCRQYVLEKNSIKTNNLNSSKACRTASRASHSHISQTCSSFCFPDCNEGSGFSHRFTLAIDSTYDGEIKTMAKLYFFQSFRDRFTVVANRK